MTEADFSGWATRNNLRCSDGRTILANAFAENDGDVVPLVYAHGHTEVENVLGHVKLTNHPEGVRAEAYFNETAKGKHAKEMVRHGDVKFLSIFANNLVENVTDRTKNLKDVLKGKIREVSLVLSGANPGAVIDNVSFAHGDGDEYMFLDEAVITTGIEIELKHSDDSEDGEDGDNILEHQNIQEVLATLNVEQMTAVNYLLSQALTVGDSVQHSDTDDAESDGADDQDEDDSESDDTNESEGDEENSDDSDGGDDEGEDEANDADSDESAADTDDAGDAAQHDNLHQEDNSMTHNLFDEANRGGSQGATATLSHDDISGIVAYAKKHGSFKDAIEDYAINHGVMVGGTLKHGIENIDYLFPDAKTLENSPAFISRRMEWVDKVLSSVRKSPFSRIKTITADITPDEARARGYIKGNMKNEEYFALAKRETTPQTIYKKQKLDRDDVIDIVDLDVVTWLKAEMRVMLDEELAGAILVGDGRSVGDDDKIKETNIRPIATDAELYVTTVNVNLADANSSVEELVDAAIENRRYYKGTGQPTFYTTEAIIAAFLTVKDNFGRRIYSNLQDVAAVLRVSDIVPVEVMERDETLVGIMVNLADYTLGADRGGQATMFDDFDIDYNKLRYLIETRCSGALTQPKAALVFRAMESTDVLLADPTAPTRVGNEITVPTVTHVTYKDGEGTTLTTGSPVTLGVGESLDVVAVANAGYYFATSVNDQWHYDYEA